MEKDTPCPDGAEQLVPPSGNSSLSLSRCACAGGISRRSFDGCNGWKSCTVLLQLLHHPLPNPQRVFDHFAFFILHFIASLPCFLLPLTQSHPPHAAPSPNPKPGEGAESEFIVGFIGCEVCWVILLTKGILRWN